MLCPMLPNKNVLTVNFLDFKKDCIDKKCLNKSNLSVRNLKFNADIAEFRTNLPLSFDVILGLLRINEPYQMLCKSIIMPLLSKVYGLYQLIIVYLAAMQSKSPSSSTSCHITQ